MIKPWVWAAAALLGGCATGGGSVPDSTPAAAPAAATVEARYPLSPAQRVTTDAAIYLGNLDARIEVLQSDVDTGRQPSRRAALAAGLLYRYRILGRLADAEAALALAEQAVVESSANADAWLTLASARSAFHLFSAAEQALQQARAMGAAAERWQPLQRDLQVALGDYAALAEDFAHSDQPVADFYELAHRADLRLLLGDLGGASFWYRTAQDLYIDVDPVPLAWLYTQQGIALLRHGDFAAARDFFAAAYARLPQYYLAAEHLAECEHALGNLDRARALYREVIAQTGNPEFQAALAAVERDAGNQEVADAALAAAERGYRDLLARHPAAYAQHAAEFFLERGQAEQALQLALQNAELRRDVGSLILRARSEAAAGQFDQACASVKVIADLPVQPPELGELAELRQRCASAAGSASAG